MSEAKWTPEAAYKSDTSDPGLAARAVYVAAILFARVSGMNAENEQRMLQGYSIAYTTDSYETEIECAKAALDARP
jgi:hypothetical protein